MSRRPKSWPSAVDTARLRLDGRLACAIKWRQDGINLPHVEIGDRSTGPRFWFDCRKLAISGHCGYCFKTLCHPQGRIIITVHIMTKLAISRRYGYSVLPGTDFRDVDSRFLGSHLQILGPVGRAEELGCAFLFIPCLCFIVWAPGGG